METGESCVSTQQAPPSSSSATSVSAILGLDDELFLNTSSPSFGESCYRARYCCAQFIVSREAVLQRPRQFYRLARKLALDLKDCTQLEHLWHAIFRREASFTGLNLEQLLRVLTNTSTCASDNGACHDNNAL
jgi:hypothetical protein